MVRMRPRPWKHGDGAGNLCVLASLPGAACPVCVQAQATKWARIIGPAMRKAFDTAFRDASKVIAARNNYGNPLAAVQRKNMRGRILDDGDGEVEIDLPEGPEGDAVRRMLEDSQTVVRPVLTDLDDVPTFEERATPDNVRVYSNFEIRAFIVSATDAAEGWPDA